MTKKIMILVAFCCVLNALQAQEKSPLPAQEKSPLTKTWTLGLSLLGAEAIGEFPVNEKTTFRVSVGGLLTIRTIEVEDNDFDFSALGLAFATATYRYYYKFKTENKKGKPLFYNSGNYLYGKVGGYQPLFDNGEDANNDFYTAVGFGWGVQRMYQNKFVFSIGLGPFYNITRGNLNVLGDFTLGIRLSPKENN